MEEYIKVTGSAKDVEALDTPKEENSVTTSLFEDVPPIGGTQSNETPIASLFEDVPQKEVGKSSNNETPESLFEDNVSVEKEKLQNNVSLFDDEAKGIDSHPKEFATKDEERLRLKIYICAAVAMALFLVVCILLKGESNVPDGEQSDVTQAEEVTVVTTSALVTDLNELEIEDRPIYGRDLWYLYDDVIGYIQIKGTPIDYMVVQAEDNEKYLSLDELGRERKSGSIFGDYRNDFEHLDENNVIYGHNMADGTMFAGLLKLRDSDFYQTEQDKFIYFNSLGYNNIFKIFSVYETDLVSFNYIQTGFEDEAAKAEFIQTIRERNEVDALDPSEVKDDAKLLTLSTCTQGGTHRLVVTGYLYAREVV